MKNMRLEKLVSSFMMLSVARRTQFFFLILCIILTGLSEVLAICTAVPFLYLLSNPESSFDINEIADVSFQLIPKSISLETASVLFGIVILITSLLRLLNLRFLGWWAALTVSDITSTIYKNILVQDFSVHKSNSSVDSMNLISVQMSRSLAGLNSLLSMLSGFVISSFLILSMLIISKIATAICFLVFISYYLILVTFTKASIYKNGKIVAINNKIILSTVQESLFAIKEVILGSRYIDYIDIVSSSERLSREKQALNEFYSYFPRYSLEGMALVMLCILSYNLNSIDDTNSSVATIGSLALASQRLLPMLQHVYQGWSSFKTYESDINAAHNILVSNSSVNYPKKSIHKLEVKSIDFENVCYKYNDSTVNLINGINLHIARGDIVGFVGSTGSGKSTIIDLIMGLLKPYKGTIKINGKSIHRQPQDLSDDYLLSFRKSISHVPQNIFLQNSTIAQNIAFESNLNSVDMARVKYCADQANLTSFVQSLPNELQSLTGENGISLSGGQRQRIGIARSIYKQGSLLVLDEATSALDGLTENLILHNLLSIGRFNIIIMIAHRISTLKQCNKIFEVSNGNITRISYEDALSKYGTLGS